MAGTLQRYNPAFTVVGIIMNLFLAYTFYGLWTNPQPENVATIISLATLMAFEFIMVHSGAMMSAAPKKISLFLLVPFYALFAITFSVVMQSEQILIIYLLVVFNRMRFAFSDVSNALKNRAIVTSVLAVLAYIILIVIVIFGKDIIPVLGLNTNFMEISGYKAVDKAGGLFLDEPHTVIVFGMLYYITLSLIEFWMWRSKFTNEPMYTPKLKPPVPFKKDQ